MAKQGPDLVDARLATALENPIRVDILSILWEGPSSAARIGRRLENVSLNLISHHMKVLKELECIELVETVSKRGARERIYRSVRASILSDEDWAALTPKMRHPVTATILRRISDEMNRSLMAGKFDSIADNHLSHTPLKLDQEGWSETGAILMRTLEEILAAGERSRERLEVSGETPLTATIAIAQFPTVEQRADDDG